MPTKAPLRASQFDGAVVILDALGTRGIWAQSDPMTVVESYGKLAEAFRVGVTRDGQTRAATYARLREMNHLETQSIKWTCQAISDTLIATASTSGDLGALLLYAAVETTPLIATGFEAGRPFRGAISVGRFYCFGNSLIGPAVDEAADWSERADWAGVLLTPSAAQALDAVGKELRLNRGPAFVRTKIPLKDGPFQGLALNWPLDKVPRRAIERAFLRPPVPTDVARKLANTLDFYQSNHR